MRGLNTSQLNKGSLNNTHTRTHTHARTHARTHAHTHTHLFLSLGSHFLLVSAYTFLNRHFNSVPSLYIHIYRLTNTHTHTHRHTHTHVFIHIQSVTPSETVTSRGFTGGLCVYVCVHLSVWGCSVGSVWERNGQCLQGLVGRAEIHTHSHTYTHTHAHTHSHTVLVKAIQI